MCVVLLMAASCAPTPPSIQKDVPALKDVFAGDFSIGCILSYRHIGFPSDPRVPGQSAVVAPGGGELVRYHMSSMSPGNNMKAENTVDIKASAAAAAAADGDALREAETHPVVRFNGDLIAQLNWAKRNGFTVRGHTLVWHNQTPTELFRVGYKASGAYVSAEVMAARMDSYIGDVIRLIHEGWPGLLTAMDVVNEAIQEGTRHIRTLDNEWYNVFGDGSYVAMAFASARKYTRQYGETQIKLYYNDFWTTERRKSDGIVALCGPIFAAGNLDGIGMQEHDSLTVPSVDEWIASYDKFYPICSEMAVTELDVITGARNGDPTPDLIEKQANQYAALFKCFMERSMRSGRGKIVSVTKDGLNDEFTLTPQASSLWDAAYRCKPAFYAVVDMAAAYRDLTALIAETEKALEGVPAEKKASVRAALNTARDALAKNYSFMESAPAGMKAAITALKTAVSR